MAGNNNIKQCWQSNK